MRTIRLALVSSALLVVVLSLPCPAHAADCPRGEARLLGPGTVEFETAQFESTSVEPGLGWTNAAVACDLAAGTFSIFHGSVYPGTTWVIARDAFDAMDIPAGTSVPVVAEIVADGVITTAGCGGSGCSAGALVSIASDGAYDESSAGGVLFGPATQPFHLVVELPLTLVAGTPRTIQFKLEGGRAAGGDHDVVASGSYRIVSVPAGVTVASCRGLDSTPTPAPVSSWGRMKAAYR